LARTQATVAADFVVHEGSQTHAQGAGYFQKRPERRGDVVILETGQELLGKSGARGHVRAGYVLELPEGPDAFAQFLSVHEAPRGRGFWPGS
jgi:hypothetical protein